MRRLYKPSHSSCQHQNQSSKHQDLFHLRLILNVLLQNQKKQLYLPVNRNAQPLFSGCFANLDDRRLNVLVLLNEHLATPMDF